MEKLRVGILGSGFGARVHVPMFRAHEGFEVAALATLSGKRPADLQAATGVERIYGDWREMIEGESLDLVAIASAPPMHQEMVLYALEKGAHVLCEKPMAMHADQTAEMLKARNRTGKLGFVNFEWRFLPARRKVREILKSGELGRILHVRYVGNRPGWGMLTSKTLGWFGQQETGGGMLFAIGSHMIDSLLWWMGKEIVTLQSQLPIHVPQFQTAAGDVETRTADQGFQAIGQFANGTTFTTEFLCSFRQIQASWRLEIFGSEGTLVMRDDETVEVTRGDGAFVSVELAAEAVAPANMANELQRYYPAFFPLVDRVYRAIRHQELDADLPLFEDGHKVQVILDAIRTGSLK